LRTAPHYLSNPKTWGNTYISLCRKVYRTHGVVYPHLTRLPFINRFFRLAHPLISVPGVQVPHELYGAALATWSTPLVLGLIMVPSVESVPPLLPCVEAPPECLGSICRKYLVINKTKQNKIRSIIVENCCRLGPKTRVRTRKYGKCSRQNNYYIHYHHLYYLPYQQP